MAVSSSLYLSYFRNSINAGANYQTSKSYQWPFLVGKPFKQWLPLTPMPRGLATGPGGSPDTLTLNGLSSRALKLSFLFKTKQGVNSDPLRRAWDDTSFYMLGLANGKGSIPSPSFSYNFPYSYLDLRLLMKKNLLLLQVPHKWGSQGNFLLKSWEVSAPGRYLPLVNTCERPEHPIDPPVGVLRVNHPINLTTPGGPSLEDLWEYAKANPNEGY